MTSILVTSYANQRQCMYREPRSISSAKLRETERQQTKWNSICGSYSLLSDFDTISGRWSLCETVILVPRQT